MSKKDIANLLMILNVNRYADVILERSLRSNEGHIGVNEGISIWTQMNGCFLEMNSKRLMEVEFSWKWILLFFHNLTFALKRFVLNFSTNSCA